MSLRITNSNNFFKVKGTLDRKSVNAFLNEFKEIFEVKNSIILSIEDLDKIDKAGVKALTQLHQESVTNNKQLSIIGSGCKELYDHFKTVEAA